MTVQSFLVFTPAQAAQAVKESKDTAFKILPRLIDGPFVGNLGDDVLVAGNYATGVEVLVGPEYGPTWGGTWVGQLPVRTADDEIVFAPPPL